MSKIIAIDDGHGSQTSGKRTPLFPDGSFMHENEFNCAVVNYLDIELQRCGFQTLLVAPTDADTPLITRTNLANNKIKNKYNKPVDFYLSVHANANKGVWNSANGIETYVYTGTDSTTIKMGETIHKHITQGTKQTDRKLKKADFHVLRETTMSAVLVEFGFMDNIIEANLLKSDSYRRESAIELAKAICEIYNIAYVAEIIKPKGEIKVEQTTIKVEVDGVLQIVQGYNIDGSYYTKIRDTAGLLGATVGWEAIESLVTLTSKK